MAIRTLPDYPAPPGNKLHSIMRVSGPGPAPAGYAVIVPGAPPTGGQVLSAADMGLSRIEFAMVLGSTTGAYTGHVIPGLQSADGMTHIHLMWVTAATGAEVVAGTDLSASELRLLVVGR